jgi:glucose/arabinose dehydrogenase
MAREPGVSNAVAIVNVMVFGRSIMSMRRYFLCAIVAWIGFVLVSINLVPIVHAQIASVISESSPSGSWRDDVPGKIRHITADTLPAPYVSPSARNTVKVVDKPANAQLKTPTGFAVKEFASGLRAPRLMRAAPNGDIFITESAFGQIRVLRPANDGATAIQNEVFVGGLNRPFGIAFFPAENPEWIYVANTDSVVRFAYRIGDMKARSAPETVVPMLPTGGHWTRDIVFSKDGTKMFVSVGSGSNVAEDMGKLDSAALQRWAQEKVLGAAWGRETERAAVLVFDPRGKDRRIYATGIRNCVGMAVNPTTGDLWCSTNERDGLGDDLPPDYITRVREGAFYGWPWYYVGAHEDPRHIGGRPDLRNKVTIPDVLIQSHSASLQLTFYTGDQFPSEFRGSAFAAEHGSWNRATRTGYKIIRAIVKDGVPTGQYEDFVTGFVIDDASVWGRPVGVVQAKDGSLLFSEDGKGTIWRVTYDSRAPAR